MRFRTPPAILLILLCSLTQAFCSDEWPQFRGPEGNGVVRNVTLPLTWSETEHVAWKVPVEGEGFSSPVITDNEIWLTTAIVEPLSEEEEQAKLATLSTNPRGIKIGGPLTLKAVCYDAVTGEKKIDQVCFQFPVASPKHSTNSYASPSPIASGDFIYCHFGDYGTCCINRQDGKVVWKNQELHADHQNGPGSSPVLWGDFLICPFDGIDKQYIAAFDIHTGKIAWKTDRSGELDPKPEFQKAYCTPTVVEVNGKPQVIS
ncbi:MAG: PQQ-binding-like beta-propeller repeat protein, partial [Planctomycetaceae bacterium]|nr:PQQ-binding-like beta-propeller repeat protein [Planctomycetaceae bacterium]